MLLKHVIIQFRKIDIVRAILKSVYNINLRKNQQNIINIFLVVCKLMRLTCFMYLYEPNTDN